MNESLMMKMKQLEEQLLHTDFSSKPELLDEFLSDDFEELSPSGYLNSREEVVGWLLKKDAKVCWLLTDFSVRELSENLVLTVYKARIKANSETNNKNKNNDINADKNSCENPGESSGSLRSSIWRFNQKADTDGTNIKWQMIFHSGTKIHSSEQVINKFQQDS